MTWTKTGSVLAVTFLAIRSVGCATMNLEQQPSTTKVVGSRQAPEDGGGLHADVVKDGPEIRLRITKDCQLRSVDRVETTEQWSTVNKSAWIDWTAGIGGAGFGALGAYALVDRGNTYSSNTNSRTYNSAGPGGDTALAVTSFVVAGALLTVAAVDIARAQQKESKGSFSERAGTLAGDCGTRPLVGSAVTLVFADDQRVTGTTDSDGNVGFDASSVRISGVASTSTQAVVTVDKMPGVTIDLPKYAAWQSKRASDAERASADASKKAWEQARNDEAASDTILLQQVDDGLSQLERAKEPWGNAEIALLQSCIRKSTIVMNHREVGLDPRVERDGERIKKLTPALNRAVDLLAERKRQADANAARVAAELDKQMVPKCIQCCLQVTQNGTRDHCSAVCDAEPSTHVIHLKEMAPTTTEHDALICRYTRTAP